MSTRVSPVSPSAALSSNDGAAAASDKQTAHYSTWRLVGFLFLHLLSVGGEIFTMVLFGVSDNFWSMMTLLVTFSLSGILCTYAAWHSRTPKLGFTCLPLKERSCFLRWLLAIPFGWAQLVIVVMEIEEYAMRRRATSFSLAHRMAEALRSVVTRGDQPWLDKFHCKAVNGIFEGLTMSAVVLYSYWGFGFPRRDPIMKTPEGWDCCFSNRVLQINGFIAFFSAGFSILELDLSISLRIRRTMQRSFKYEILHWLFRTSEVIHRVTLQVAFMVLTRKVLPYWWYLPLCVDMTVSLFFVDLYGGCEVTWIVRLLCAVPCSFVNVFRFIDSPSKRRAALKLSNALNVRNLIELIVLPTLVFTLCPNAVDDVKLLYKRHATTAILALVSLPVHGFLTCYLPTLRKNHSRNKDIFTACERGDIRAVMKITMEARVGIDLNIFDIDGKTPLMLAVLLCGAGDDGAAAAEICRLLVEEGARVDLQIFEDRRLLWRALWKPMRLRWTALHIAAWKGNAAVVEALVEGEHNFGVSFVSSSVGERFLDLHGNTPLHVAARGGHAKAVRSLISEWPNWIAKPNNRGQLPIDVTRSEEVRLVLNELGAAGGETPLLSNHSPAAPSPAAEQATEEQWRWVRLAITFSDERGPCRAPGLSSYLASAGGGTLGRIFLPDAAALPTIDESTVLSIGGSSMQPTGRNYSQAASSSRIAAGLSGLSDSTTSMSQQSVASLRDLEPVDKEGNCPPAWVAMVEERERIGKPLGSAAFLYLDKPVILGSGSFGVVWRARDRRTGERFAVKNIRTSTGTAASTAEREYEMSNHIRMQPHPCIVRLHQVHSCPEIGFFLIVMELCPGGDLLHWIRTYRVQAAREQRQYTPPPMAQKWLGQVFLALEHLHLKMGALLRDLKPDNVVINDQGLAKLTDFGFGRFDADSDGTWSFGVPPGSPGYIAPESLLQQHYDCRADLYSYGVLIWVLLTGGVLYDLEPRPPVGKRRSPGDFTAHANDWQYLQQCLTDPERAYAPPLSSNASPLVSRLVQRRPDERPLHAEIRQYPFLQELGLPEAGASRQAVVAWIMGSGPQSASCADPASMLS